MSSPDPVTLLTSFETAFRPSQNTKGFLELLLDGSQSFRLPLEAMKFGPIVGNNRFVEFHWRAPLGARLTRALIPLPALIKPS